jgi:predicted dehydrogenase
VTSSSIEYLIDERNGATLLTIPFAHALDMQARLLGELEAPATTIATLRDTVLNTDTGEPVPMTAPDQIAVRGRLTGGAVASMHFRGGAPRTTPFTWEIDGTRGSLRLSAIDGNATR